MRIETNGNYEWRQDLYDQATEALGESARSKGLDGAAELVLELLGKPGVPGGGALQDVAELLDDPRVPDDVALEIAEAISVGPIDVKYRTVPTDVHVGREGDLDPESGTKSK